MWVSKRCEVYKRPPGQGFRSDLNPTERICGILLEFEVRYYVDDTLSDEEIAEYHELRRWQLGNMKTIARQHVPKCKMSWVWTYDETIR